MKILIVEDDTLLLQGLILAAQTEGYACDGVTTARMAEQSLEDCACLRMVWKTNCGLRNCKMPLWKWNWQI